MRRTQLVSKWPGTTRNLRLFWWSGSVALRQLALALIAINAYGQTAFLSSPRELLATDPRAFAQWLDTNRPKPVSADQKTRILASLPPEGEVKPVGASSQRKLVSLNAFLLQIGYDSTFAIRVVNAAGVRIVLYERTIVLIPEPAFIMLGAEELQALVAHEIGHKYLSAEQAREPALKAQRGLKDLELLCDAIAIVLLRKLEIESSRLVAGIEKITKYNWLFDRDAEERTYPSLSERRKFAREVTAWLTRGSPPRLSR